MKKENKRVKGSDLMWRGDLMRKYRAGNGNLAFISNERSYGVPKLINHWQISAIK
ncbi:MULTISPECIES: hypothetical protein [unclassified Mesotoga]|uniref:hypothetical protein n=1 Tax=unclassified Mesotoga TaxID=1184398 RepID=UPI000D50D380|nr:MULTISPECIES: hypothetical protein [unclassified Mesotoga]PVD18221.1 hypothetical protein V512_015250 [Mesotoga sp. Brook.08.105.5.1]RAO96552.1 hypothetical protein M388_14230 [Mesotoga sp. Brook.08.YT.4.2.5.4.]